MKRKGIKIKEDIKDVPLSVDQVYWYQYKEIVKAEVEKGNALNHLELVITLLGEDREYWRSKTDVEEYIYLSTLLFKIYEHIKARGQREGLKEIIISEYAPEKKKPFWKRNRKKESTALTEIIVEDKVFRAPTDLRWQTTGQYQDALEVTSVIHDNTESLHLIEAYERLFKIYFYPIISGKSYDVEKALELNVDRVRFSDVLDFGVFFLIQLNQYQNGIKKKQQRLSTLSTKLKLVSMK